MITMTTTVFKKATLALIGLACAAGVIFSVGMHQDDTKVQAATSETHRVWVNDTEAPTYWFEGSAVTGVHFWGTGVDAYGKVLWDAANSTKYYDIPLAADSFQILRIGPLDEHWDYTGNLSFGTGTFWLHNDKSVGYDSGATHSTTTIVSNFINSMNTDYSICSKPSVESIVNSYNGLSTFEQDQFDATTLTLPNGGTKAGIARLNELISDFSVTIPLNANDVGGINQDRNNSLLTMLIIGLLGLSTLGGYIVISRKKNLA